MVFSSRFVRFGGEALLRIVHFLLMERLGRGILGVFLLFVGVYYGLGSHTVNYRSGPTGAAAASVSGDGTDYIRVSGDSTIYIIKAVDFDPYPNPALVLDLHAVSKLVYQDKPTQLDLKGDDGIIHHVTGYNVAQFAFQDASGTDDGSYATVEYHQHPGNYYANQWPIASILLGVGALFLLLATLIPFWVDKIVWREKPEKTLQG
jgi:hypothetical protein